MKNIFEKLLHLFDSNNNLIANMQNHPGSNATSDLTLDEAFIDDIFLAGGQPVDLTDNRKM